MLQIKQYDTELGTTEDVSQPYTNKQRSAACRHLATLCTSDHCHSTVFYIATVPYQRKPKKENAVA